MQAIKDDMDVLHLAELNIAQREAATYGIERGGLHAVPPLLIIAGPGSGKTKTLTHRVAHLILNGADPRRILLVTFARRMAVEMTRRVEHICAAALRKHPTSKDMISWSGTFHAMGAKLLRLHAETFGLDPAFTILDRGDAEDLIDLVRDELKLSNTKNRFPRKSTCLAIYSYTVNAQTDLVKTLKHAFPWCLEWEAALRSLFGAYVIAKQAQNVLDYDDLLFYWTQAMEINEVADMMAGRFDHVLVDEYQDTNALQANILLRLKPNGYGLTVVGDDAQSIYSFRSATIQNILGFPSLFTPAATTIKLEQNYRSTLPILQACNEVISHATEGYSKSLFSKRRGGQKPVLAMVQDDMAQVEFIIDRVLANREVGMDLREQAVLMRASSHSSQLEIELTRRNIPFVKFGGLKFLEAGHIKDVLAILRWAENPQDQVAGLRVLQLLPGVGSAIGRGAMSVLTGKEIGFSALETFNPPVAAKDYWTSLIALMNELAGSKEWKSELERLRKWYDPLLTMYYESGHTRIGDLEQLERIAVQHPSRVAFLSDVALDPPEAVSAEAGPPLKDEDWLILSTIHSAKGQEWKAVYILNVVDGCIPSDLATGTAQELEEERRLLYVAMTRAKDDLTLVQPMRYYLRGQASGSDKHIYAPRSRFIAEEGAHMFEMVKPISSAEVAGGAESALRIDLKSKIRSMW